MKAGRTSLAQPEKPDQGDQEVLEGLLRLCADRVESNPSKALPLCRATVQIAPLLGNGCQVVQAYGIMSDSERSLGCLQEADKSLDHAFSISAECLACFAALHWRRGMVRRDQGRFSEALIDFDTSLDFHSRSKTDHDLHGNGFAKTLLGRGSAFYEAGKAADPDRASPLISAAVADMSEALSLISPTGSSKLYRIAVFNLAAVLAASGKTEDLRLADSHLRMARRLFKGVQICSQERAKIDWLTAMIRYELRAMKLHRVYEYLTRAQSAFIEMNMKQEAVAVAADISRIAFPDQNKIRDLVSDVINRTPNISSELCKRLRDVIAATNIEDWNAPRPMILKSSIEALRRSCGTKMLACLISWPAVL